MTWDLLAFGPPQDGEVEAAIALGAIYGLFFCAQTEHHGAKKTANEAEAETGRS